MIYMEENYYEVEQFKQLFTETEHRHIDQFRFKPLYETYALEDNLVKHTQPCYWLWNLMSVYWNGDVALCCMDYDSQYNMGNLVEQSVKEVWNSRQINDIRKAHRGLKYDDMSLCNTCDIPEQGYFNTFTILGSTVLSASQVRKLIPVYERFILLNKRKKRK